MLSRLDDIIAGCGPAKPAVLQRHWSGLLRSDWNMIFVFSGKCRVCVDETILCDMEAGSFYLFSPGERRHYNADGEFHCFWCHFVPDISVDWKNLSGNCFIYTPSEQESARLRNNMDEVLLLFGHHVQGWHVLTKHLIEEIILRGNMQNSISHIPPQILHACSILSDPTKNHYSFSEIAKKIGMSRSVFFRSFKKYIKTTPQRYREARMLKRAVDLLEVSTFSLNEISAMSGFSDQYYFSRRFKTQFGISPGEYRKQKM